MNEIEEAANSKKLNSKTGRMEDKGPTDVRKDLRAMKTKVNRIEDERRKRVLLTYIKDLMP